MTIQEAREWVERQEWVYAKSYSDTFPHHYTTRSRCSDEKEFEAFFEVVREHGKVKTFMRKQYVYLEIGDYEYWEMGRPIKAVQVLNRAKINDAARYRFPMPKDGQESKLKATLAQRDAFLNTLLAKNVKTAKDDALVTALLCSKRRIHGGGKNIIDHSSITFNHGQ